MIKGLVPKLAEGGKIKIGGLGEVRNSRGGGGTYRLPQRYDSFTITTTRREGDDPQGDLLEDTEIMVRLAELGFADDDGKIRTIPVVLHSDDIDEVFLTEYVAYAGKKLNCRGDGERATRRHIVDGTWTGESRELDCPCDWLEADDQGVRRCKYHGVLHCSLRIPGQSVAGAVHRWRTTSQISCEQMVGSLLQILQYTGALQGLPLVLRVRPVQVAPKGKQPMTVYVCHVELRENLLEAQRAALEVATMRGQLAGKLADVRAKDYRAMLQAPGDESTGVGPEFYPGAVIAAPPPPPTPEQVARLQNPTAAVIDIDLGGNAADNPTPIDLPPPAALPQTPDQAPEVPPEPQQELGQEPPPPAPAQPAQRTRKTRCKSCQELAHGVQGGKCPACREGPVDMPPAAQAPAPPSRPASPDATAPAAAQTPGDAIGELVKSTIARGVKAAVALGALREAWPDADTRTWTTAEVELASGIMGGLDA